MGLFWFGVSVGSMCKIASNKMKRKHMYHRPWEFLTWSFGMGIAMVYYDAFRRQVAERICAGEEYGQEMHTQKLFMVQDVWFQEPAIKKETH